MGFNTNEVYASESSWLKAADLQKKKHKVVISDVQMQELENNGVKQRKLELHFQGRDKTLLLNKTNSDTISYILGPDTDGWLGKPIFIYPTMVDFAGKSVEAIRVETVMEEAAPVQAAPANPIEEDFPGSSFEADIPF